MNTYRERRTLLTKRFEQHIEVAQDGSDDYHYRRSPIASIPMNQYARRKYWDIFLAEALADDAIKYRHCVLVGKLLFESFSDDHADFIFGRGESAISAVMSAASASHP